MKHPAQASPNDPARCPACGAENRCALNAGGRIEDCWCARGPVRHSLPNGESPACLCPGCLAQIHRQ